MEDYPYRQWIEAPSAPAVPPPADSPCIPIFSLDSRWLIDTGSGMDLCGKRLLTHRDASDVPEAIVEGKPMTFNTANGPYKAKKQVLIDVSSLGPSWGDITAAYIMNDTPAVLSVGKRVCNEGFSFLWLHGKTPCFITPDGSIIPFDVQNDCPYIVKGLSLIHI